MVIKKLLYVLFAVIIVLSVYTFSKEDRADVDLPEIPEKDNSGYFQIKNTGITFSDPNKLSNLDKKRGIKNLIIGTHYDDYNFDPDWMIEKDSISEYKLLIKYPDANSIRIGNSGIERILLVFYKDTLISIDFTMDRKSKERSIHNILVFLYGYPNLKEYYWARDKQDFTIENVLNMKLSNVDTIHKYAFLPREYFKPTHASYRETLPYTHTYCAVWESETSILEYYNIESYSESYIHTNSNVYKRFNSVYQSAIRISSSEMQNIIEEIQGERKERFLDYLSRSYSELSDQL